MMILLIPALPHIVELVDGIPNVTDEKYPIPPAKEIFSTMSPIIGLYRALLSPW